MSAARVIAGAVQRALPADYTVYEAQITHDNPDERAVAVYPMGGGREDWGIGSNVPRMIRDRVRIRMRALASDCGWIQPMAHRLRLAALDTPVNEETVGRVYFGSDNWHDGIRQRWIIVRARTDSPPRFTEGRKYTTCDIDIRVTMRPLAALPHEVDLAWAGSPFTVYESESPAAALEVQRLAVTANQRAVFGGTIRSGPAEALTNPADDPFPEGAPQGAFQEAEAGQVLWRNLNVGVDGDNLFDATTTNMIPEAEGGGLVRLLRIIANADNSVSFVTREEFGKDLADNGLFLGRAGGTTYLFRLAGAPRNVGGDLFYDVPAPAGFTTAAATAEAEWDWAFADGTTWRPEPWVSQPPAVPRWSVALKVTDAADTEVFSETWRFPLADGAAFTRLGPIEIDAGEHGGTLVQSILVRDESTPPVGSRMRYAVPVSVEGMIVHGEPGAAVAVQRRAFDAGFSPGFG